MFFSIKKILIVSTICLFPLQVSAESILARYKRCVSEKRADLEKPIQREAYRDRGCITKNTTWDGRRHSCRDTVCWAAPPHHLITDAHVWDHSANGSEHSYGATQYLPSREFATRVCNTVHARSKSGNSAGRGWQKLSANVTIRRQATQAEIGKIEATCEKEVLGQ